MHDGFFSTGIQWRKVSSEVMSMPLSWSFREMAFSLWEHQALLATPWSLCWVILEHLATRQLESKAWPSLCQQSALWTFHVSGHGPSSWPMLIISTSMMCCCPWYKRFGITRIIIQIDLHTHSMHFRSWMPQLSAAPFNRLWIQTHHLVDFVRRIYLK